MFVNDSAMRLAGEKLSACRALTTKWGQGLSPDKVKKAKDFLWKHLEEHNKELLVFYSNPSSSYNGNPEIANIIIGFEYKKQKSPCSNV